MHAGFQLTAVNLASNIPQITVIHFGMFENQISLPTMETLILLTIQKLKIVPQQYIFCETEEEHK
jgi:hypothetical protein